MNIHSSCVSSAPSEYVLVTKEENNIIEDNSKLKGVRIAEFIYKKDSITKLVKKLKNDTEFMSIWEKNQENESIYISMDEFIQYVEVGI